MTGRPQFKVTAALRREVEQMISCGMSEDDVARAISCTTPTLRKHFEVELQGGRAKRRREVIGLLYRAARKGNVSAQRKLEDMTGLPALDTSSSLKAEKLGKKEQAQRDAEHPDLGSTLGDLMNQRLRPN